MAIEIDYVKAPRSNLIHVESANVRGQAAGVPVCSIPKSREADAERIVKSWNSHDMLIDALEAAFVAMGRQGANSDVQHPLRHEWDLARRALQKAGVLA